MGKVGSEERRLTGEKELEAKNAGGKEWEGEFLFFYRCCASLDLI